MEQSPDHATIQLYASSFAESCQRQQQYLKTQFQLGTRIYNYQVKGKKYCGALYGHYPSLTAASNGINKLPKPLKDDKPWARTFKSLQAKSR